MAEQDAPGTEFGSGSRQLVEKRIGDLFSRTIHVFLIVLAIIVVVAAMIAAVDTVLREFPAFFKRGDQYNALQHVISNILLIAIAAEIGLLLLFHRTSAAIEVIILVVARKIVSPETTALELLLGVLALSALIITRYFFLSGFRARRD